MRRRTLDLIFSGGGVLVALLLVLVGALLANQASFAENYVRDQLGSQKITFAEADSLSEQEKTWKPESECLVEYAGKLMETGEQAECYASYFIALHMSNAADNAGFPGETYATMGGIGGSLRADIAEAEEAGNSSLAEELQAEFDTATSLRSTFQTGETLRGLLLTTYGFSIFGDRADLIGTICFVLAGLLLLLSASGFIHALRTSPEDRVGTQT